MKQVHWIIPFKANDETPYEIRIYSLSPDPSPESLSPSPSPKGRGEEIGAEGCPIRLIGDVSAVMTEEDKSENPYFAVRGWTGNIGIVNEEGVFSVDELMPATSTDRSVELVVNPGSADEKVVWQGFLSCESFSQEYTSRPKVIQLNIVSPLEAAESVEIDDTMAGEYELFKVIGWVVDMLSEKFGRDIYEKVYFPREQANLLKVIANTSSLFKKQITDTEEKRIYEMVPVSVKEVLKRIASFGGLTMREDGKNLYLYQHQMRDNTDAAGQNWQMVECSWTDFAFIGGPTQMDEHLVRLKEMPISDLKPMGTDHKYNYNQGAKSVEIVVDMEKGDTDMGLPEFPYGDDIIRRYALLLTETQHTIDKVDDYIYVIGSKNETAHSYIQFYYPSAEINMYYASVRNNSAERYMQPNQMWANMLAAYDGHHPLNIPFYRARHYASDAFERFYAGAFYATMLSTRRTEHYPGQITEKPIVTYDPVETHFGEDGFPDYPETTDGIYCVFFPNTYTYHPSTPSGELVPNNFDWHRFHPIMSMQSVVPFGGGDGYLNITSAFKMMLFTHNANGDGVKCMEEVKGRTWSVGAMLQVGNNQWWDGEQWQHEMCRFRLEFNGSNCVKTWKPGIYNIKETDGTLIPTEGVLPGEVELSIYPDISDSKETIEPTPGFPDKTFMIEMFFSKLDVGFIYKNKGWLKSGRESNHYYTLLNAGYSDTVQVDLQLASDLNNISSITLLKDLDEGSGKIDYIRDIAYLTHDGTERVRPEHDLMRRYVDYYKTARRRLELEVKHPEGTQIPLLRLSGYETPAKVYAPLSERREWKSGVSVLTCFEVPE